MNKDHILNEYDKYVKKYKLSTKKPILLVTQHSVATEFKDATSQIKPTLDAVIELAQKIGITIQKENYKEQKINIFHYIIVHI